MRSREHSIARDRGISRHWSYFEGFFFFFNEYINCLHRHNYQVYAWPPHSINEDRSSWFSYLGCSFEWIASMLDCILDRRFVRMIKRLLHYRVDIIFPSFRHVLSLEHWRNGCCHGNTRRNTSWVCVRDFASSHCIGYHSIDVTEFMDAEDRSAHDTSIRGNHAIRVFPDDICCLQRKYKMTFSNVICNATKKNFNHFTRERWLSCGPMLNQLVVWWYIVTPIWTYLYQTVHPYLLDRH